MKQLEKGGTKIMARSIISSAEARIFGGSFFTSRPPETCGETFVGFLLFAALIYIIFKLKSYGEVKLGDQFPRDEVVEEITEDDNFWTSYKKILYKYIATNHMLRVRLFAAVFFMFAAVGLYRHALLTYSTSLFLWSIFPVLPKFSPYFSLGKWILPLQVIIALLYGIALALFVSIFYTVPKREITQLIIFSTISLLVLAVDAD
jgi:hypothetical protein